MRQSSLLVVNAAASYARMLITVGMGLVVVRLVRDAMGPEGYGLFVLLGGGGALLMLLADSLSLGLQRHLAFEIGAGDTVRARSIFSTGVALFAMIGLVVAGLAAALSFPLPGWVRLPEDDPERAREWADSARIAFVFVGLRLGFTVLMTPWQAAGAASQSIVMMTLTEVMGAVMTLAAAVTLVVMDPGDPLVVYSVLMTASVIPAPLLLAGMLWAKKPFTRFGMACVSGAELGRVAGFAGWAALGNMAWRLRMQGSAFVLNLAFGPLVNDAYGTATQAAGYQQSIGSAIRRAAYPAIVSQRGAGREGTSGRIAIASSKFLALSMSLVLVPLMVDPGSALTVWLGEIPEGGAVLLQLVSLRLWLSLPGEGISAAVHASGRMRGLTLLVVGMECAALVFGAVGVFVFGWPAWSVPAAACVVAALTTVGRVGLFSHLTGVGLGDWWRGAMGRVVMSLAVALAAGYGVSALMPMGLMRLVCVGAVGTGCLGLMGWGLVCSPQERGHFTRMALALAGRVGLRGAKAGAG